MTSPIETHPPVDLLAAVKRFLRPKRLTHTVGVRNTALDFHSAWGLDRSSRDLLSQAAILHDLAKDMGPKELHKATEKGWVTLGVELLDNPRLAHAPLSAAYAEHQFGVRDPRALLAIAYHPTGHPNFDDLGIALFLADYLEPTRRFESNRESLLSLARREPYQATLAVLKKKSHYVQLKGGEVHPVALAFERSIRQHLNPNEQGVRQTSVKRAK